MKLSTGILRIVILIMLLMGGIAAAVYSYRDVSPGTLQHYHPIHTLTGPVNEELLRGAKISGEVKAVENNLGTIAVGVRTFNRLNNDILVFQMKEIGATEWQVFNKYFTDRFPANEMFPFGFPVITDSKGKTYEFEFYSVNGVPGEAIGIGAGYSTFESHYTFTRAEILSSSVNRNEFLYKKLDSLLSNFRFLSFLFTFNIPLIVYGLLNLFRETFIVRKLRSQWLPHTLLIIIISVFIIQTASYRDNMSLLFAALIILVIMVFRLPGRPVSLAYALILLVLSPYWIYAGLEQYASKSAVIAYYFLVIALIFASLEYVAPNAMSKRSGRIKLPS